METPFCKACHASLATAKSLGQKNNYNLLSCHGCGTVIVDPFPTAEQLATEHLPAVLLTKQNELDRLLNELNEISNALKSKASPDIQDLSDELMRAVDQAEVAFLDRPEEILREEL